jgi:hypothetical protein
VTEPIVGSSHCLCIADHDEEARRIGARALAVLGSFLARAVGDNRRASGTRTDRRRLRRS